MDYLSYQFQDTESFINTFDELPLWSAPFGLLLLKNLELRHNMSIVDIGSGAGFPLIEIASRAGKTCKVYGVDPWINANKRVKEKIKNFGLTHVELFEVSSENIPLPDNSIDLIVSNLGINNFDRPKVVFKECHRILKPNGRISITSNLFGHWKLFYDIFYNSCLELGSRLEVGIELAELVRKEELHRATIESIIQQFDESGFKISKIIEETLEMKFLDGSSFLNHHFIKIGWLGSWKSIIPENLHELVFRNVEKNLNHHAELNNGLLLTVPIAYVEATKN
ncbi:MAG: methyltransferase domain-containing protein [Saprospiraceae bacterium]|nr:methyltransferase domain-containing protein [Saprospiraceae bacterium]